MIAEYKRDMNHNYLILTGETEADTASYPVRMLLGNIVPALLKCHLQGLNGKTLFYYEITSRQSLASFYENRLLGTEDLQMIFGCLIQILEKLEEYLLDAKQLILNPDYLFLNLEKKELCFCYFPGYEREVGEQFRMLVEYLLPKLDHGDEQTVSLGYGIYRKALTEQLQLEEIRKELYQIREGTGVENTKKSKISSADADAVSFGSDLLSKSEDPEENPFLNFAQEIETKKTKTERKKPKGRKAEKRQRLLAPLTGCAFAVGTLLAVLIASKFGYLPQIRVEYILSCVLIGTGAGILVYQIPMKIMRERRKEESLDEALQRAAIHHEPEKVPEKTEINKQADNIWKAAAEECHETVVLSAGKTDGPASLVSREPGEFATIYLKEELTVIGKMKTASDAVIPLPTISRIHAKIRKKGEDYYLTDLNSRNGTSVNGQMLRGEEEHLLQDEDEVDFAQARYIFLK